MNQRIKQSSRMQGVDSLLRTITLISQNPRRFLQNRRIVQLIRRFFKKANRIRRQPREGTRKMLSKVAVIAITVIVIIERKKNKLCSNNNNNNTNRTYYSYNSSNTIKHNSKHILSQYHLHSMIQYRHQHSSNHINSNNYHILNS